MRFGDDLDSCRPIVAIGPLVAGSHHGTATPCCATCHSLSNCHRNRRSFVRINCDHQHRDVVDTACGRRRSGLGGRLRCRNAVSLRDLRHALCESSLSGQCRTSRASSADRSEGTVHGLGPSHRGSTALHHRSLSDRVCICGLQLFHRSTQLVWFPPRNDWADRPSGARVPDRSVCCAFLTRLSPAAFIDYTARHAPPVYRPHAGHGAFRPWL